MGTEEGTTIWPQKGRRWLLKMVVEANVMVPETWR